jgi:hypothetical protein
MLSAKDVQALGGQNAVYAFRKALHMAGGGDSLFQDFANVLRLDDGAPPCSRIDRRTAASSRSSSSIVSRSRMLGAV